MTKLESIKEKLSKLSISPRELNHIKGGRGKKPGGGPPPSVVSSLANFINLNP